MDERRLRRRLSGVEFRVAVALVIGTMLVLGTSMASASASPDAHARKGCRLVASLAAASGETTPTLSAAITEFRTSKTRAAKSLARNLAAAKTKKEKIAAVRSAARRCSRLGTGANTGVVPSTTPSDLTVVAAMNVEAADGYTYDFELNFLIRADINIADAPLGEALVVVKPTGSASMHNTTAQRNATLQHPTLALSMLWPQQDFAAAGVATSGLCNYAVRGVTHCRVGEIRLEGGNGNSTSVTIPPDGRFPLTIIIDWSARFPYPEAVAHLVVTWLQEHKAPTYLLLQDIGFGAGVLDACVTGYAGLPTGIIGVMDGRGATVFARTAQAQTPDCKDTAAELVQLGLP